MLNRIEIEALRDAADAAHQFDDSLGEQERQAVADRANTLEGLLAAPPSDEADRPLIFSPLDARALRYAAETDAAISGEAYAGLAPDALRELAERIERAC